MRTDRMINDYLRRTDTAASGTRTDALHSHQMKWLRTIMHLMDLAMEDEGVPEGTRTRVLRVALYGTVEDPHEVMQRPVR